MVPHAAVPGRGQAVLGRPVRVPGGGHRRGWRLPAVRRHARRSAAVAGGSLRAVEAILRGDVEHAQHPGGGLHHAMPERASGFCIYDDPALAIARARRDGLRVMYIDLDVHHGDGVQAMHWDDPGVLTISFHETGRALFPGTGDVDEVGEGVAAGTSVNVPLPPGTGERAWLAAVSLLLPELAATFAPDLIVSQHGADSHAWDPLAHLNVTTTAHGAAARLVDTIAHRYAKGRWLATGGGGYDAYRVVPRTWALTWLAGAHRRSRTRRPWPGASDGRPRRHGTGRRRSPSGSTTSPMPGSSSTPRRRPWRRGRPGSRRSSGACWCRGWFRSGTTARGGSARALACGHVGGGACEWHADDPRRGRRHDMVGVVAGTAGHRAGRSGAAHGLILAGLADGARVTVAVVGPRVVGLAISRVDGESEELLALGVEPSHRRQGLAGKLLEEHSATDLSSTAEVTLAERDVLDPLDAPTERRSPVGCRRAGYRVVSAAGAIRSVDPSVIVAGRGPA